jgi:hypothetical protein
MRTPTVRDVKSDFGRIIDLASAESVALAKRGHPVIVTAVVEIGRLKGLDASASAPSPKQKVKV